MLPNLADGTVIMIDPMRRLPKTGDVVLLALPVITLHRVRKVKANQVWLQGDALRQIEGPYPLEYVVGIARLNPLNLWQRLRLAVRRRIL